MHWADKFVGIPFCLDGRDPKVGLDCFGLVRAAVKEVIGIELSDYEYAPPSAIMKEIKKHKFVDTPEANDIAVIYEDYKSSFGWKQAPIHLGIFVNPKSILHIERDCLSRIQPASQLHIHSVIRL